MTTEYQTALNRLKASGTESAFDAVKRAAAVAGVSASKVNRDVRSALYQGRGNLRGRGERNPVVTLDVPDRVTTSTHGEHETGTCFYNPPGPCGSPACAVVYNAALLKPSHLLLAIAGDEQTAPAADVFGELVSEAAENPAAFSSAHPIEVSRYFRGGGRGYKSFRQRVIDAGQLDLFGERDARNPRPAKLSEVRRELGSRAVNEILSSPRAPQLTFLGAQAARVTGDLRRARAYDALASLMIEHRAKQVRRGPHRLAQNGAAGEVANPWFRRTRAAVATARGAAGKVAGAARATGRYLTTRNFTVYAEKVDACKCKRVKLGKVRAANSDEALDAMKAKLNAEGRLAGFKNFSISGRRVDVNPAGAKNCGAKINPTFARLFETFHGAPPTKVETVVTSKRNPARGYELGGLKYIEFEDGTRHDFDPKKAKLNASEGNRLYISGVRYARPRAGQLRNGLCRFCKVSVIAYNTRKAHLNDGRKLTYWHPMSEDSGPAHRPNFNLDAEGYPVLTGQHHAIDERGIID